MLRVAVIGAKGRMGATVCEAVALASDMDLVGQFDLGDNLAAALKECGATHAVDFTLPAITESNVTTALRSGVNVVVGTTGWTAAAYERVRAVATQAPNGAKALIAPNFAISAVLAMKFAAAAAPYFESAEVIEMHHPNKVDAPSGTATATAQAIAASRATAGLPPVPDATETDPGHARGALVEGIPVHAVRLRGLNAHEEILLGNAGEQLVIRSDCFDRGSFMPGVLLALRAVADCPAPLTVGIDSLLNL